MNFAYLFFLIPGIFCICAAAYDWDWFFENSKARAFTMLFGRDGARLFYGILGVFIMVLAMAMFVLG